MSERKRFGFKFVGNELINASGGAIRVSCVGAQAFIDELIVAPLPDYPGQHDFMHLMSLISPVDKDLAVTYSRLLPEPFRQTLLARGYQFVDVPDEEFETMGGNVLALGPRECVMLNGNPKTAAAGLNGVLMAALRLVRP